MPDYRCKVIDGRVTITYKLKNDAFSYKEEDEDIQQYVEDNIKDFIGEMEEIEDIDLIIRVEDE